jgi:hypothetical protein
VNEENKFRVIAFVKITMTKAWLVALASKQLILNFLRNDGAKNHINFGMH